MKSFCIPRYLAADLKAAASRGEIDIKNLYDMSSSERRSVFEQYTDKVTAKNINTGFEESMVSAQTDSLKKWAEETFVGKKATKEYEDVLTKINQLEDQGLLSSDSQAAVLEDLISSKLGTAVTTAELSKLSDFAKELEAINEINSTKEGQAKLEDTHGFSIDLLKKRREMNNYIESLTPSSNLRIATSVIARSFLVAAPKTMFLNIQSNTLAGTLEAITRRLSSGHLTGISKESLKYIKFAAKVYKETGYDITRSLNMQLSPKVLGEKIVSAQGEGAVRKLGRITSDIVFSKALGLPDVVFSAFHNADTAQIMATIEAKRKGLKGAELKAAVEKSVKDSFMLNPKTEVGEKIKIRAIENAELGTFQNSGLFANISLSVRGILNDASGDVSIGDLIVPFVKTPANVLEFGFNYSIGGVVKGTQQVAKALNAKKIGDVEGFQDATLSAKEYFVRAGLGLSLAFLFALMFDDDEYVGSYPTNANERELFKVQAKVENSVKIGDSYVSLDYLGPLAVPIRGFLSTKKSGGDVAKASSLFVAASLSQLRSLPGLEESSAVVESLGSYVKDIEDKDGTETANKLQNAIIDFVTSRSIPGVIKDISKMLDSNQREVDYKDGGKYLKSKIPFGSGDLEAKVDTFGDVMKQEDPLSILFFGSRIKTKRQNEVLNEVERLQEKGFSPSLTDWEKSSKVSSMKKELGEAKYAEMEKTFKTGLKDTWFEVISGAKYDRLEDAEKQTALNSARSKLRDQIIKKYGYKEPRK